MGNRSGIHQPCRLGVGGTSLTPVLSTYLRFFQVATLSSQNETEVVKWFVWQVRL
jgi:hypothetical protein